MKRLAAAVMTLLMLPVLFCTAADVFSLSYTPKSANSSVFYLDVCCAREMSAAVFEVNFDESMVKYASASAGNPTSSVRDRVQSGKVSVAFADSGAVKGTLCRLSFKALQTGATSFTLHIGQSADENLVTQTAWDDYTLSVRFGKDDVTSSGSVKSEKTASSSAPSSAKKSGEKAFPETADDEDPFRVPDVVDLRDDHAIKWILIGAGIPVLCAALVWLGITIGKKSKASDKKAESNEEKPGEPLPEPNEENNDDESPS